MEKEVWMFTPLKRLTKEMFERHSNPWSAWTSLRAPPSPSFHSGLGARGTHSSFSQPLCSSRWGSALPGACRA